MQLIHAVISVEGFRDSQFNGARMNLLSELVRLCTEQEAKLLVIPAGFLTASSKRDVPAWIDQAAELANRTGVAIIGGVDIVSTVSKGSPGTDQFPYFGFAVGPVVLEKNSGHLWRQTSTNNVNADLVGDANVPGCNRCVTVDGKRIGVLICGELFSWRARNAIARLSLHLIVDIGHSGMGQGLIPAMRSLAIDADCSVAHSQHIADWRGRGIHYVIACGKQESQATGVNHLLRSNVLWAAWALRTI